MQTTQSTNEMGPNRNPVRMVSAKLTTKTTSQIAPIFVRPW